MPFTLAHPVAALPLWWGSRQRLDLPALMVGSLVPDVSYYLHLQPVQNAGHTLLGAMRLGIPWGLGLLLVGIYWLMPPCLALLPPSLRFSPRPYTLWPWPRLVSIILSIYLGAVGHIVWDSFTHRGGWTVRHWPLLAGNLGPLPLYAWLQYSGGVLGLAGLLLWAVWRCLVSPAPQWRHRRWLMPFTGYRLLAATITLGLSLAFAYVAVTLPDTAPGLKPQIVRAVIGSVTGGSLGVLCFSSLFWLQRVVRQWGQAVRW